MQRQELDKAFRICAFIIVTMLTTTGGSAQKPPVAGQDTTVNLNYVYAASLGFGGYTVGGLTADVYTLPLFDTLQNVPTEGWALRLMLPVQFGNYHFSSTYQGVPISLSQQSIAAVPGAELDIPITTNFVLKPFVQGGAAYTFGSSSVGNPGTWVYLAGAHSVAQWHSGDYTFSLGNGVVYAGDAQIGPGPSEDYVSLQIAAEVRRPLGFTIGNWEPDLGVYVADYYYPAPLQFSRFLNTPLRISNQNEVGFSVGSAEPLNILWFSNPRLGAGFVFGQGLKVWRLSFGFPF